MNQMFKDANDFTGDISDWIVCNVDDVDNTENDFYQTSNNNLKPTLVKVVLLLFL